MKVLAFDTSTTFLTIACVEDNKLKKKYHKDVGIRHSEILIEKIKDMLDSLGWTMRDLDLICVGSGPGSFTGLRVAMATVKGFLTSLSAKAVVVPTVDAMAGNVSKRFASRKKHKLIAPFLDARKNKIYTCVYDCFKRDVKRVSGYILAEPEDFLKGLKQNVFFFGDAVKKYKKELDSCPFADYSEEVDWYPKAVYIARIGIKKSLKKTDNHKTIEPLYLHEKECSISR
ncbi:MAG: tRNA (adenosine(37)-N6)-threonylcarbamoyltransferase complex dimerization subunit type 1 TsaB [Candidatus Omnitrophota bacterium]|nr:tRNA (adenosine(37)-N6)-threonylcarbamoyltransferase complex dimerization subunit type 1 TsaB [Candidatus Omnitrophota bacterium]MBU1894250.1 tRNA (adenosine(37)-N6)-threonylcarbamoyltransferase complex dimerization subunit type 1 TsaB [Candidatus Omnitrophota bacterium]